MSESKYQDAAVQKTFLFVWMFMPLEMYGLELTQEKFLTLPVGLSNPVKWNVIWNLNKTICERGRECLVYVGLPDKSFGR